VFRALLCAPKGSAFGNRDLLKKVDQNFYTGSAETHKFGLRFRRKYFPRTVPRSPHRYHFLKKDSYI
jgi:hypothetical protein